MSDIKDHEPLWGAWYVDALIGQGSYGSVYKVRREDFGKFYYSAVKILSIPQDEAESRQMLNDGFDEASMSAFYHALVTDILNEIDVMSKLRGNSNIVSFEDHKVIEKTGAAGWDILMRMELLESLPDWVDKQTLSADDVIKLGIHMCRALELCAVHKIIHRDIKPDNIFVSQYGEYKLGDFGIARQIERSMSGLSKKGTFTYMAPEVFRGEAYGAGVDIYSLGIVMYHYLNQKRSPFMPDFPQPIMPSHIEEAVQKRMSGVPLPDLKGVSPELNEIVLQACAYSRKRRFASPEEMRAALEALRAGAAAPQGQAVPVQMPVVAQGHPQQERCPQPIDHQQQMDAAVISGTVELTDPDALPMMTPVGHVPNALQGMPPQPASPGIQRASELPKASKQPKPPKPPKAPGKKNAEQRKIMVPLLSMGLSAVVILGALVTFFIIKPDGYGISVNGQTDVVVATKQEAKTVLEELTAHYSQIASSTANAIHSITFEEDVVVAGIKKPSEIQSKKDALQSLIDGRTQSIDHTVIKDETVGDIAKHYSVTAEAIAATNQENWTEESQLAEGAQIRVIIGQPYLHVVIEGQCDITEEIDYETETKKDDSVVKYTTEVQRAGEKGSKNVTCTYVSRNGVFVQKNVLTESVVKEPVTEIVLEGTKSHKIYKARKGITDGKLVDLIESGEIPAYVTELDLSENAITDLTPLKSLTGLEVLHLDENNITNLKGLESLSRLTTLTVTQNSIKDIRALALLTQLTILNLADNSISVLTPLKSLTKLVTLNLNGNNIGDITPLQQLKDLKVLSLQNNRISDLSPLIPLKDLTELYLSYNSIKDLTPLKSLINLRYLALDNNRAIENLQPLFSLTNLAILSITETNLIADQMEQLKQTLKNCSIAPILLM